jgi:hypothetical protein
MTTRRLIYLVPAFIGLIVLFSVFYFADDTFPKFYEEKMRASLFTGFFTLSGFLLTAKTFIILNMKKEMFSTKMYLKHVETQSRLLPGKKMEVYRPLRDIGHVLLINVSLCLAASISQFTFGLCPSMTTVAICLALAAGAAGMLVFSLTIIARNLRGMYDHFEEEAQEEIKKFRHQGAASTPAL